MTQRNTYATFAKGAATSATPFKDYVGESATQRTYLLGARACQPVGALTPAVSDCVEVFAEPQPGIDTKVTMLAIDTQGRRRCTGSDTSRCWN